MTVSEVLSVIDKYSLSEKFLVVEQTMRKIKEQSNVLEAKNKDEVPENRFSKFVGVLTDDEADAFEEALAECRKIDSDEW